MYYQINQGIIIKAPTPKDAIVYFINHGPKFEITDYNYIDVDEVENPFH